jgi:hypothetical protein
MNCSTILFTDNTSFAVIHNLPYKGLNNIYDAVVNWKMRTMEFTAKSLCDYINSKYDMTGHIAFPKEEYDKSMEAMKPKKKERKKK